MIRHPSDMMINDTIHHHDDTMEIKPLILLIWWAGDEGMRQAGQHRGGSRRNAQRIAKSSWRKKSRDRGENGRRRENNERTRNWGGNKLHPGRPRDRALEGFKLGMSVCLFSGSEWDVMHDFSITATRRIREVIIKQIHQGNHSNVKQDRLY